MNQRYLTLAAVLALVLSACSGGGGDAGTDAATAPPVADAFITRVQAVVAASDGDKEADAVDGVTPSAPESAEALPVK